MTRARLHHEIAGDHGSPVLLIMGLIMPGRAWVHQVAALSAHHRVITFDNRGIGRSERTRGPYRMDQLADDAVGLLDELGLPDAHIVGVSMGGHISQHLALRHRDRVRSLSLIATHAGGWRARLPDRQGIWWFLRAQTGDRDARGRAVANLLYPKAWLANADPANLRALLENDLGQPVSRSVMLAQVAAILGHDAAARLRELAGIPTLIVRPGLDCLIRPRESDRLHRLLPHARLVRIDDAGHGVIRQCPDTVNAELLRHFAEVDAALALADPAVAGYAGHR